ncbi:MAG: sulfurtransferase [Motiliproteus sp.]|nr:sulfurtransferase [Motiliproteus sp.]MCW9052504.1 sulfurtransferase [Motiliproteus sp.]
MSHQTLVSAELLSQHLDGDRWVVLDGRFNLADTEAGRQAYQQDHIPGAIYVHLDEQLSSTIISDSGRHPLPDSQQLADWLGSIGINSNTQVVVYDAMGGAMAARCWWLLKTLGHENVAVLDGGYPRWQSLGLPSDAAVPAPTATTFENRWNAQAVVSVERVVANLDAPQFQMVDARNAERFRGEQEPIDPVAGHIPNALNRDLSLNLESDGCFKPAQQLLQEWQQLLNQQSPENIVHSCGSGVTACHNQLAMEHAGLTGSRVYAGSWSEWIRDPKRPVATG